MKKVVVAIMCMLLIANNFADFSNICAAAVIHKDFLNQNTAYQYKLTPEDAEWAELTSHQEMLDICQLPEEILTESTTEELFDIVLDYPLLIDISFYASFEEGLLEVAKQFNGLNELLKREDLSKVVKEKYERESVPTSQRVDYSKITIENVNELLENDSELRKEVYLDSQEKRALYFEESLLSSEMLFDKYTKGEKAAIVKEAYEKMEEKCDSSAYDYQAESEFFSYIYDGTGEAEWKPFIDACYTVDFDEAEAAIHVEQKSGTEIAGSGLLLHAEDIAGYNSSARGFFWVPTHTETPRGSRVECILYTDNPLNTDEKVADTKADFPEATIVAYGYHRNNCHAYAWASRQDIWMNDPSMYTADGSYTTLKWNRPTGIGQKVMWDGLHSGVVVDYQREDPMIISKWGDGYVMKCTASYVPYGGHITYYHYSVC